MHAHSHPTLVSSACTSSPISSEHLTSIPSSALEPPLVDVGNPLVQHPLPTPCAPPFSFAPEQSFFMGCWNVRTLLDPGSQCLTMRSLHHYDIDIACLSETRIPDTGLRPIKVPGENISYWLYYSGPNDNSGQAGVAIAVSPRAHRRVLAWNPISPRIAVLRIEGKVLNISVISVYAPTRVSEQHKKDAFYERLQKVMDDTPSQDHLLLAGDWNARVGKADSTNEKILGLYGVGERCENGDRLVRFASFNRLCVASTNFRHPKNKLLTWFSNDGRTSSQIDHILVRQKHTRTVVACRSYKGAETGNAHGSDHVLVRAQLMLRLNHHKLDATSSSRIDTSALKQPQTREKFCEELRRRFETQPKPTQPNPQE